MGILEVQLCLYVVSGRSVGEGIRGLPPPPPPKCCEMYNKILFFLHWRIRGTECVKTFDLKAVIYTRTKRTKLVTPITQLTVITPAHQFLQQPSGIHSLFVDSVLWIYKQYKSDGLQAEDNKTFFRHRGLRQHTYYYPLSNGFSGSTTCSTRMRFYLILLLLFWELNPDLEI